MRRGFKPGANLLYYIAASAGAGSRWGRMPLGMPLAVHCGISRRRAWINAASERFGAQSCMHGRGQQGALGPRRGSAVPSARAARAYVIHGLPWAAPVIRATPATTAAPLSHHTSCGTR
jgi:hypothetical protein